MITDEILLNMHSVLSYWSLKRGIFIRSPLNSLSSLRLLINKYNQKFLKSGYKLQIEKENHVQFGSCDSFNIRKQ